MSTEGPDGIPQLVTCIAGCGFRGDPQKFSLCSACWQVLQKNAGSLNDDDAINHAFVKAGFDSLHGAKLAVAFGRKFGGDPPCYGEEALPAGVQTWRTIIRPLTQYDEFPQRGSSACTYIAGFAALWSQCKGAPPSNEDWALCIVLGVKAFHAAREADATNCMGAVAPTTAAVHMQRLACAEAHLGLPSAMPVFEETVLLLAAPQDLGNDDAVLVAGHCADFEFGKAGLAAYFRRMLPACQRSAVIVVRPPETYSVMSSDNGAVALRDSHRRSQLDFDDIDAFLRWLEADRSIFAAAVACPLELNCVGLYRLAAPSEQLVAAAVFDGMGKAKAGDLKVDIAAPSEKLVAAAVFDDLGKAKAGDLKADTAAPSEKLVAAAIFDDLGKAKTMPDSFANVDSSATSPMVVLDTDTGCVEPATQEELALLAASSASSPSLDTEAAVAEASYVMVSPMDVDVDKGGPEQRRKRACTEDTSPRMEHPAHAPPSPAPETPCTGRIPIDRHLADALRRIADLERDNACLAAELAAARGATAPVNDAWQVASASPYPPTTVTTSLDAVSTKQIPTLDDQDVVLVPSLQPLRFNSGGMSPVMRAASSAAITRENQELESDLQFILARLPAPTQSSPKPESEGRLTRVSMQSMMPGRKREPPPADRGPVANASEQPAFVFSQEAKEQWFTYLDNDGDGRLSQSDVLMGLCRLLRMEANPELVRPVRQLLTACWEDFVSGEDRQSVTKEAFLRANSGLADTLVANLRDPLLSIGLMTLPAAKAAKGVKSRSGASQLPDMSVSDNCCIS